ncbi:MAG: transporter substrate-binding domain-containing protein, partial [Paracoccus sp. (in: a-proteobacteria)]|nr:transporter substrate-binding domain-containing protein [Paracoccus sp. (in: a-proteobacteria)]
VVVGKGIAIGMRKSDTELKAKFDTAIEAMIADGTLNTMITKWFGEEAGTFE